MSFLLGAVFWAAGAASPLGWSQSPEADKASLQAPPGQGSPAPTASAAPPVVPRAASDRASVASMEENLEIIYPDYRQYDVDGAAARYFAGGHLVEEPRTHADDLFEWYVDRVYVPLFAKSMGDDGICNPPPNVTPIGSRLNLSTGQSERWVIIRPAGNKKYEEAYQKALHSAGADIKDAVFMLMLYAAKKYAVEGQPDAEKGVDKLNQDIQAVENGIDVRSRDHAWFSNAEAVLRYERKLIMERYFRAKSAEETADGGSKSTQDGKYEDGRVAVLYRHLDSANSHLCRAMHSVVLERAKAAGR